MTALGAHLGRRLGDDARAELLSHTSPVDFVLGEEVIRQGKPVDGLLWIAEGSMAATVGPDQRSLPPLNVGDLVGVTGAMTGSGTANVVALGDARCLFLSLHALDECVRSPVLGPVLVDLLLEHFAARLRALPEPDRVPAPTREAVTLREHPALKRLDAGRRELVARLCVVEQHARGHVFATAGEQATAGTSHGWLLLDGTVAEATRGGHVHRIAAAGDGFGFVELVDDGPRESTCTATSTVTTASLDRTILRELRHEAPDAALALRAGLTWLLARDLADRTAALANPA